MCVHVSLRYVCMYTVCVWMHMCVSLSLYMYVYNVCVHIHACVPELSMYVYNVCVHTHVCVPEFMYVVYNVWGNQRASDAMKLELQMIVRCHVELGINSGPLQEHYVLLTAEPCLQPYKRKILR